jgi:hypothetical protein
MIVSHRHRFIFVKTLKTAGTSIEVFLCQHCGPDDVVTPILPHVEPHRSRNHEGFYNHMPATEIRARVGPTVWASYFKFCVERNPWDKTLSFYHMQNAREGGGLSLDEFLRRREFPVNWPIYADDTGVIVDRVIRYEQLTAGLDEVFTQLGIPFIGSLGVNAKSEYRTDRRPYRDVYSTTQADLVAQAFAREIEIHGYRFE